MAMVQYSLWSNCSNNCDFCLIDKCDYRNPDQQIEYIQQVIDNVKIQDWKNKFQDGISLLGGEIYFITDPKVQEKFMELIDVICEYVIKQSPNPNCKYSTVTNGIYNPEFLFRVIDYIVEKVGIEHVDVNFSYDLKYRFKSEESRKLCIDNIVAFHKRYNYRIGVQMILTQHVIDSIMNGEFDIDDFENNVCPGCILEFLYPHKSHTGIVLTDFNFDRKSFLQFMKWLHVNHREHYFNFYHSVGNSSIFKYTGLWIHPQTLKVYEEPVLSNDKEIINDDCGHSILYQCYSDCSDCMYCDLINLTTELEGE